MPPETLLPTSPATAPVDISEIETSEDLVPHEADVSDRPRSARSQERADVHSMFLPENLKWYRFDWIVVLWMLGMHIGAIAAPFFFSWSALGATIFMHWLTCSIGICLGYHRCLSHKSFKLKGPARFMAMLAGTLSGEGSPLMWAATHRLHHARSDEKGDPHSPLDGPVWSHLLWMFIAHTPDQLNKLYNHYAPDLLNDRLLRWLDKYYGLVLMVTGAAVFAYGGWSWFLWVMCLRMTLAYHSTWFVNSATHLWGYRNYETTDHSRNLWWVAIAAYGEGWHNNHHAHPRLARAGHKWWEFDATWLAIRFLQLIGQATDVDDRIPPPNAAPTS